MAVPLEAEPTWDHRAKRLVTGAEAGTVPGQRLARKGGEQLKTLAHCRRFFGRKATPPIIAPAIAIAIAARWAIGGWSWVDLMIVAGIVGLEPLTEWMIHVFVLHAKPRTLVGRVADFHAEPPKSIGSINCTPSIPTLRSCRCSTS